jgi:hypothetical protein
MNCLESSGGSDELSATARGRNGRWLWVLQVRWLEFAFGHGLLYVLRVARSEEESVGAINLRVGDTPDVHGLGATEHGNGVTSLALVVAHLARRETGEDGGHFRIDRGRR